MQSKVEAERCGMYYVNERWLGGMLTNFKSSRIKRLKDIEENGRRWNVRSTSEERSYRNQKSGQNFEIPLIGIVIQTVIRKNLISLSRATMTLSAPLS